MITKTEAETMGIITDAARACGLVLDTTGTRRWDYSPHLKAGEADPTPAGPQVGVLCLAGGTQLGFNRQPAVVGVFGEGPYVLVWDDFREGWGLTSRIGHEGCYLKTAIALEATKRFAEANSLDRSVTADGDTVTVRLWRQGESAMQMKQNPVVVVEIDPKGAVKIEVEGGQGASCSLLTRDLEKALGSVQDVEKKPEYHKEGVQHVNVGQG